MSLDVSLMLQGNEHSISVFEWNITHNLIEMAAEAGIYEYLWSPEEKGATTASDLIAPLEAGLELLKSDPERFKAFNPQNGWGNYEGLVEFVTEYLKVCRNFPACVIAISR